MKERPRRLIRAAKRLRNLVRDPHPRRRELVFEDYELAFPDLRFRFRARGREFVSRIRLVGEREEDVRAIDPEAWHALMVTAGLTMASAHWKLTDFATLRVRCAALAPDAVAFLERFLRHALGEFRYLEGLDPTRPIRVVSEGDRPLRATPLPDRREKALLFNGGGKDSVVAAELLKRMELPFAWYTMHMFPARQRVIDASGVTEAYGATYAVDREVERRAAYRFPATAYSAIFAAAGLFAAHLHGARYLVVGNEFSANVGNVTFKGMDVNHQYTKSLAFERDLGAFVRDHVLSDATYFSLLGPFYELRLAQIFSRCPDYFPAFISCNRGLWKDLWCNDCEKCAFIWLALYPFVRVERLRAIFGADLFALPATRRAIWRLVSARIKPWECVGTREESRLALALSLAKSPELDFDAWPRRADLEAACRGVEVARDRATYLAGFHEPHNVPAHLVAALADAADSFRGAAAGR